jgi:hypothetical protein
MMARVWICQCLCPDRHCIMMASDVMPDIFTAKTELSARLRDVIERAIKDSILNPWCGMCRLPSSKFQYETTPTRYDTLEEAAPFFERLQREQRQIAALFSATPR